MNGCTDRESTRADRLSGWLIHRAARSAPESLAERLEEEWLADLAARPSAAARVRFALGCCWATRVIAYDHAMAAPLAAAPGGGAKSLLPFTHERLGGISRRTLTLALVTVLHLAVFYALMVGLSINLTKVSEPPLQNKPIPPIHTSDLPPPPSPKVQPVKLDVPPLDTDAKLIHDESPDGIRTEVAPPPPVDSAPHDPVSPAHVVKTLQGGPGVGFPNPDEYYPDSARRMEEHGIATVRVCVDPHGRLTTDPTTLESTGSARLDEGALKLARAGSGHYRATTEDGMPVNACYAFRVRFQLKN